MGTKLPLLLLVTPAFFYLLGYAYLNSYFGYFDVGMNELSFGIEEVLINSAPVIMSTIPEWWISVSFVSIILLLLFERQSPLFLPLRSYATILLLLPLLGTVFLANDIGELKAIRDIQNLPIVEVYESGSSPSPGERHLEVILSDQNAELRFLTASESDYLFVITYRGSLEFFTVRIERGVGLWSFTLQDT